MTPTCTLRCLCMHCGRWIDLTGWDPADCAARIHTCPRCAGLNYLEPPTDFCPVSPHQVLLVVADPISAAERDALLAGEWEPEFPSD